MSQPTTDTPRPEEIRALAQHGRYDPASEPEVDALSAVHPPTGGTFHA